MLVQDWLGADNELGINIWERKYRNGNESFDEWLDRVSGGDQELRNLIAERKFLLGGRTLANRGTNSSGSYFNCYSRGFVEDSYKDIMQAAIDIGLTFKGQGGQGISLTKLRPKGTPIGSEYFSDGIIPFMKIYNEVTAGTSQGGARKGALMLSIDARHKEAKDFIKIKSQEGLIEKANLSLEIDDEFMEAVRKYYDTGEVITLHEKHNYSGHMVEYDVVPIDIFKLLVENCYDWADPAALFVNRFRNYNLMQYDDDYVIETCNPCGEQPLPKHGACCLSSLNLSEFVKNPYTSKAYFDTSELVEAVKIGIKTLDKLIDENYYRHPLKEQQEMSFNYRNIGLGAFGYATMLMKLGMKYGSPEALNFTDQIFGLIFRAAVIESNNLAKELGVFPKYKDCVWDSDIMKYHFRQDEIDQMRQYGLRNCSLISIAPNGSTATTFNESGGCEPQFAMRFTRRTVGMTEGEDTYFDVYCKAAQDYMNINNTDILPDYFISAPEIPWRDRIETQAIMQRHVDTAISSTVNLPNSATKDDIAKLYLLAWQEGLKGVTIFRDGCKRMPILSTKKSEDEKNNDSNTVSTPAELPRGYIIDTSDDLIGKKRKLVTGCVDADTEYFNGTEWKKISEYKQGEKVLQYNQNGTAQLVYPLKYIKEKTKGFYHITSKYGLDMKVSKEHRNVVFSPFNNKMSIVTTEEMLDDQNKLKNGFYKKFKLSFKYSGDGIPLTDDEIRISVAIFADGCFYSKTLSKCLVSVAKERKAYRLRELLTSADIDFTERVDSDGYYNIKFYPPIQGRVKAFPKEWYNCTQHQFEVILDEVFRWDGYENESNEYSTIIKSNADFIQFACASLDMRGSIYKDSHRENMCYRVDWSDRNYTSIVERPKKVIPFVPSDDGYEYCFSVPSTMLVLRRNDKIFITGNCGSLHCTAFFDPISGDLMETYLSRGSTGGCSNSYTGLSRMISLAARSGVGIDAIVDQLNSCGVCPSYHARTITKHDTSKGACCPIAIGKALKEMWLEMQEEIGDDEEEDIPKPKSLKDIKVDTITSIQIKDKNTNKVILDMTPRDTCPECGEPLLHEGGCDICKNCGWSKCN